MFMPESIGEGEPVLMKSFPKEKLSVGNWQYLSFWIKPEKGGDLLFVLPEKDWQGSLSSRVRLSDKINMWTKIRLSLNNDMAGMNKKISLKDLRGELFIYNITDGLVRSEASFLIDNICLE